MSEINVTPLVDVMLVLLVVFMITAPLLTTGVSVNLPEADAEPIPGNDEPIVVTVQADGRVLLLDTPVEIGTLAAKLAAIASAELEAAPEDIVIQAGRATVAGTDAGIEVADLARLAYHSSHRLAAGMDPGLTVTATYDPAGTFSNACQVATVEVDPETGGVRVDRFVVVEDAGRLINPMIVDGQLHGGVTQGIAGALYEEIRYDGEGNILTTSLMDFLPPTLAEVPTIEVHHLETISDATITGAKGLGEGGTIGAPAAIINAVSDALRPLGVEVTEVPATPSRLRRLVRESERIPA